jgi:hypothetical protein
MSKIQTTNKSFISVILFLILSSSLISAQEKKNEITISGIAAHYINNEKYQLIGPFHGYYKFPVDPGVELLYFRSLSKNTKLGAGLNFQKGRVASYLSGLRRFQFYEITIPALIQRDFILTEKSGLFLTCGIYSGKTPKIRVQTPDSYENWHEMRIDISEKSSDIWFTDLYFDAGYYSFQKIWKMSINPFMSYRINDTWLNLHEKKFHYGIKLSYTIGM